MGICRKYVICSVVAWLCGGAANCLAASADGDVNPIYWKQTVFSIPYQINRPAGAEDAPVKVLLLVSRDGGINWKTLEAAEPKVKGFIYNAEEDGEYWFAVQTIDRFGRSHPAAAEVRPELHVVVDTEPPKLDVTANVDSRGELVIQCHSDDPHIERDSLSVGVRAQDGKFQPLGVPGGKTSPSTPAVQLSYAPPLGTRTVQVRAEISDLAGNRSVSQIEVDLLSARQRPVDGPMPVADARGNGAGRQARPPAQNGSGQAAWNAVHGGNYPSTSLGQSTHSGGLLLDPPGLAGNAGPDGRSESSQAWPVDSVALAPPAAEQGHEPPAPGGPSAAGQMAAFEPLPPPQEAAKPTWSTRPASSVRSGGLTADQATLPLGGAEPTASRYGEPGRDVAAGAGGFASAPVEEIPPGEVVQPSPAGRYAGAAYPDTGAPLLNAAWQAGPIGGMEPPQQPSTTNPSLQMVNSRTIAIDYELASLGPWGVSEVELWGTRDGGQTWRRYAVDDDNRSPVTATVEGEGDYGFRVVVHSAGGFAAAPPQPGEVPEVLVRVDLIRPEAVIESVQQGAGNAADQILIRWSADDAQLGASPVALYFSPHPAGPWSIIAAGLPNSGSYAWRAERHLPEQLYVRLEVRDAAGNVATFQTAEPIAVQRPRPQVRIREVRPFESSAAQAGGVPQR